MEKISIVENSERPSSSMQNEGTSLSSGKNVIQSVIIDPNLAPYSMRLKCPFCQALEPTRLKVVPNTKTHLIAAIICTFGGFCGCCCIPYCLDICQNTNHYCAQCNRLLGIYRS